MPRRKQIRKITYHRKPFDADGNYLVMVRGQPGIWLHEYDGWAMINRRCYMRMRVWTPVSDVRLTWGYRLKKAKE